MEISILKLFIRILAAMCVMIFHEIVKSCVYYNYVKRSEPLQTTKGIFKVWRYIDPIGIIFASVGFGIFSKQYPYLIKSKKTALTLGFSGFFSMLVSYVFCKMMYLRSADVGEAFNNLGLMDSCLQYFWYFMMFFSVMMFVINIFPIVTFDISLILGASARGMYLGVRNYDSFFKVVFLIMTFLGTFTYAAVYSCNWLARFVY